MDFLRFLITKKFLRHLLLVVLISVILLLGTLLGLKIYTHHGQAILVPNLTGLTINEVRDVVSSRRLRYEVIDSIYTEAVPRGTVVKQNPRPNSKVKLNRRLFITMNAVHQERVSMPRLVDLSDRQARLAIENAGLMLGEISYRPYYARGSVLQQKYNGSVIEEGTMIPKGASIDLVLGMGLSDEKTTVPDLVGLDLMLAKEAIQRRFLNFGIATYDATVETEEDSLLAFVYRQDPPYSDESLINKGIEVFVWMTLDSTLLPEQDSTLLLPQAEDNDEVSF
jgi:beta-lactam-binding protein with PASTA domain